jgi:ribosomal subunit interface protein
MLPLQVTFQNMKASPAVRERIAERVDGLKRFHDRIMSCRVVVRAAARRHHKGNLYSIAVDLKLPGREIAATRAPEARQAHEDIYVAIRDAFDAVERRLEDVARRRRGDVKAHEPGARGVIARLLVDQDYGFIRTAEDEEVYFHRNSVLKGKFDKLKVGQKVRLAVEPGEKGLQASTVHVDARVRPTR